MRFTKISMRDALMHAKDRTIANETACDFYFDDRNPDKTTLAIDQLGGETVVSFTDGTVLVTESDYDDGCASDPCMELRAPLFYLGVP
jgi:hypothetical protein